jgi:sensor c-di-GMP phosphodiesterase-like protein
LAGYFLAREITAWQAGSQLDQYAGQLMADGEMSSAELRTVLAAMGAARNGFCSSSELAYFQALIFESDYVRDAGRMRNGKIECSVALGRSPHLAGQLNPDITLQDGTAIYKNLAPYQNNGLTAITEQQGDAYVVFTPLTRMHLEPAPMHYIETVTDEPTQKRGSLLGEPLKADMANLGAEGRVRQGDSLFATRCSIRFYDCVTAFTTLGEVAKQNRGKFGGFVTFAGVLGGLIGLAISLLYRRNKSYEQQLRRAIRGDKVRVVYQPVVDLASKRVVGAEALARWSDEDGLPVSPDIFVRIAEKNGFVGEIAKLVVRHVLADFGPVLRGPGGFRISVNVAAADLADPEFLLMLERALTQEQVEAQRIVIEITEGSTVKNHVAMETIRLLRQRGHFVHIDDFGTGYSSLSYLQDLSVDAIKIDKAFTQAIGTGSVTVAILPQILAMAESLNLGVIVEGVETGEQADYFAAGPKPVLVQGWLFGRPVPAAEFHKRLQDDAKKAVGEPRIALVSGSAA